MTQKGRQPFSLKDVSVKGFIAKEAHGLVSWKDRVVRLTKVELIRRKAVTNLMAPLSLRVMIPGLT